MGGNIVLTGITSGDITGALGYTPASGDGENYYLTGVSKSNNTFTFHVDGASDPTYQLTSGDITGALGYSPQSAGTDDQTLDEVLSQGNTSASGITIGASTISYSYTNTVPANHQSICSILTHCDLVVCRGGFHFYDRKTSGVVDRKDCSCNFISHPE